MPELKGIQLAGFNVAVVSAVILCLYFSISGGAVNSSPGVIELQSRVNPNDAPAESLARLPGIGIIKANAIVEYRLQFRKNSPGNLAFKDCNDLDNVKGIGFKTVSNMCKYLRFE
jgi:competence ComEA-like helix-hairpin-helix protein